MKKLYYIRHGITQANVDNVWSGTVETPRTAAGKAQAKKAGQYAKALGIDHIICSPLGRTRDTAAIIAAEIGYPKHKIEINSLLIERHYGAMEGQPVGLDTDVDGFVDAETADSIVSRARLTLEHLQALDAEVVLIVGHGTFGRALRSVIHPHLTFEQRGNEQTRLKHAEIVQLI